MNARTQRLHDLQATQAERQAMAALVHLNPANPPPNRSEAGWALKEREQAQAARTLHQLREHVLEQNAPNTLAQMQGRGGGPLAYCVSCKSKEPLSDVEHFIAKNGRAMARGHCPHGHKACVILSKEEGEGLFGTIVNFAKPLIKPLLNKAKDAAIAAAKAKAAEIAAELAKKAVEKIGDKIKEKVKGAPAPAPVPAVAGKGRRSGKSKGKGIDSVPHKQVVKTMFYGPLGGEGLYLPGSPESRVGHTIAPPGRPYIHVRPDPPRGASPAPAPAQVAHQQSDALHSKNHPVNITAGKGRKPKGSGLF